MKILHLIQKNQLRGAEVFTIQLGKAQQRVGHEVRIVGIFDTESAALKWDSNIETLGANTQLRWVDIAGFKRLDKIITSFKPDVIQANAGDTLKYAVISSIIYRWNVPIIFRNASVISNYINNGFVKKMNGFLLKRTNGIASVSKQSLLDIRKTFPFTHNKSKHIPIAIGEVNATPVERPTSPLIVHVGGFSFEKNHIGLLSIFKQVLMTCPEAQLWLVGDGPLKNEIVTQINKLGLVDNIKLTGFVPNPLDYIKAADVLVLPSIIEGLPGVILESFKCNTPVVAYNVGGIPEILHDGTTGYLIPAGEEEIFARQILKVLTHRPEKMVANARIMVDTEFTMENIVKQFDHLYHNVLS